MRAGSNKSGYCWHGCDHVDGSTSQSAQNNKGPVEHPQKNLNQVPQPVNQSAIVATQNHFLRFRLVLLSRKYTKTKPSKFLKPSFTPYSLQSIESNYKQC